MLSFIATAITLNLTFHKQDILESDAQTIQKNLHKKEAFINDYLADNENIRLLKSLNKNEELSASLISNFRDSRHIYFYTYNDHALSFWGANVVVPESDAGLKDGSNTILGQNGLYEAIKKTYGRFSVVCYIPIKASYNYPKDNPYIKNIFSTDLIKTNRLEIAQINDKEVSNIRNSDGQFLFSVKLKSSVTMAFFSKFELFAWILSTLFGCILMNYVCVWIAAKGHIKTAILVFFVFFLVLRLLGLEHNWAYMRFDIPMFDSKHYAANFFLPSIGHLFLNLFSITWLLAFAYSYRHSIKFSDKPLSRSASLIIFFGIGAVLYGASLLLNNVFSGLVENSNIDFDVTNILNLDMFSWLGILLLCMAILNLYLLLEILLATGLELNITNRERLIVFATGIFSVLILKIDFSDFDIYFLLFGAIILVKGWAVYNNNNEFNLGIFVFTILVFAIIASVKLSGFQYLKEQESRKILVQKLESSDDPNAVLLFSNLEENVLKDDQIIDYFKAANRDYSKLNNRLQKFYFDLYLSRYDFKTFEYNTEDNSLDGTNNTSIDYFKNLVISGSIKVSQYFYRINNTFGYQHYFALLPIVENDGILGTLVVELKSKSFDDPNPFPLVLVDGNINETENLKNYSFAFYRDGELLNQYGKYIYNLVNTSFKGSDKNFVFTQKNGYSHLIYQTTSKRLIVISKPVTNWIIQLASVSFLFLVLLFFSIIILIINWLWKNFSGYDFPLRNFRWNYLISKNRILYKTRIQATMISAVVFTLVLVGLVTYFSISFQYKEQQEETVLERINKITSGFEKQMFDNGELKIDFNTFNSFAAVNAVDLNYFDPTGRLVFTTQPKIYTETLLDDRMDALAFINLNNFQRSEYINKERIGEMEYLAAYKPVRNNRTNEIVAYLNLPYFSNVHDFEERIGQFLNTLINVYALVFVAIGFFAVFMANRITYPLTLVQKSLSQTKIDRKNEPIIWKRNDEIGNLIREYNTMIAALEESAQKLARSERETAWKEMAKQVAHEIKNPLTPLKLGVQLLDKSWKEKDPNFDKKFERFSKSFIEQIESLAHIASEFSNFAKMPETSLENVKIREIIDQSIEVFKPVEHVTITLTDLSKSLHSVKGDKDQLLRCFNNLIKNAIEAIPENKNGLIEITIKHHNEEAHIQVKDNGKGIPEGLRERIFNPNFTTKSSGTGLGLAFVKQAIENMLGTIRFETELNTGTTFYITLPLA